MNDLDLIEGVIHGDPEAGDAFVHRYVRFIWTILRDCGVFDVEDACQTVFLRLWENGFFRLRQWREREGFHRYLAAIVRNLAQDLHRRGSHRQTVSADPWYDLLADPRPGPEREFLDQERGEAIKKAVELLSEEDQDLFRKVFLQGKTPLEIAQEAGIQRNAADQRIHQMKRRLREALRGLLPELV